MGGCGPTTAEAKTAMDRKKAKGAEPAEKPDAEKAEPQQQPIAAPLERGRAFSDWLKLVIQPHGYDHMGKRLWFPRTRRLARWLADLWWKWRERRRVTRGPKASDALYEARLAVCTGCMGLLRRAEHVGDSAGHKLYETRLYCSPCKCGENPGAELHTKLRFRYHECPMGYHPDGWGQLLEREVADARETDDDGDPDADDGGNGSVAGADTSTASAR